ncbi:MAG: gliding motility-associated C-terminal domain-containing protein, partial [Anaerolineales bacterium]|nr:gliding motility-associated C-terminal domain-containing protein [Anaerolineales bacterium]
MKHVSLALVIVLTLAGLNIIGCSARPLLSDVAFYPEVISPNADGHDDAANVLYKLSRNASLSIYIIGENGESHYHRNGERRSVQTDPYWTLFSGVVDVDEVGTVQRRMLPDGQYTWVIEATDDNGHTEKAEGSLTIVDADTTVPELQGFSVSPQVFSPNRDG